MKMKRIAIAMAAAAIMAVSAVSLTACGGESGAPDSIEGTTWVLVEAEYNGQDYTAMLNSIGGITVEFEGGKSIVTYMGQTGSGSYTYEDGQVTLSGGVATIDGNRMIFSVDGIDCVMEKR